MGFFDMMIALKGLKGSIPDAEAGWLADAPSKLKYDSMGLAELDANEMALGRKRRETR